VRHGEADPALVELLAGPDNPLRRIPKLYGKVQGVNPARFLTYEEAYGRLVGSCSDDDLGLRDEVLLRLGLAGIRVSELISLQVGDMHLDHTPATIDWIGKARRKRQVVVGDRFRSTLSKYLGRYERSIGREPGPADPLLCRGKPGSGTGQLSWGRPIAQPCSVQRIVKLAADRAGLGHMSPHDLRRSAAAILHRATTAEGAHHFDLLDIQRVLDHQDPATTMRPRAFPHFGRPWPPPRRQLPSLTAMIFR
jgi:integrase